MNLHRHTIPHEEKYQTPQVVAAYMVDLLGKYFNPRRVLEPTPGEGAIVAELTRRGYEVTAPRRFEEVDPFARFDATVMNPPFLKGVEQRYLACALTQSDIVIALLPWFALIDSDLRTRLVRKFGLVSVTHLPRSTFPKIRVQTCILEMHRGYEGPVVLHFFPKEKLPVRRYVRRSASRHPLDILPIIG